MEDAYWSQALDPVFRKNYEKDPTLTWQYFGSASGLFRNFPGKTSMSTVNECYWGPTMTKYSTSLVGPVGYEILLA